MARQSERFINEVWEYGERLGGKKDYRAIR